VSETEYSEMAQSTAKDVLKLEPGDPRTVLLSLVPFVEADDIPGCNLVMKAWMTIGTKLPELVSFASQNKQDEVIGSVLNWFRDNLLPPKGKGEPKFDMTKEDIRAQAWFDALD